MVQEIMNIRVCCLLRFEDSGYYQSLLQVEPTDEVVDYVLR
jgi:hypothetical protein